MQQTTIEQPEERGQASHMEISSAQEASGSSSVLEDQDVHKAENIKRRAKPTEHSTKIVGLAIGAVSCATCCSLFAMFTLVALGLLAALIRLTSSPIPITWITIPEGEFLMGSPGTDEAADTDEIPQHPVYLDTFQIMPHEVTNWQYVQCIRAEVCRLPDSVVYELPEYSMFPVYGINWQEAQIFCAWVGGRLPTEAEWEKAARGGLEGKLYPWGDEELTCERANYWKKVNGCVSDLSRVGSYEPNGYGLYDMSGNVREWVMDWYAINYYYYSPYKNPKGPRNDGYYGYDRVVRNGSWIDSEWYQRSAYRGYATAGHRGIDIGFRCARSPHLLGSWIIKRTMVSGKR